MLYVKSFPSGIKSNSEKQNLNFQPQRGVITIYTMKKPNVLKDILPQKNFKTATMKGKKH